MLWFNKSRRAQSADDYETWLEGGVVPTLNAFDNGDIRTTVAVLMRMREGKPGGGKGPLLSEDRSLTIATNNDQTLFTDTAVRRLTPLECERLQGFPDNWTEGQSDSARYKQMGNAVAVPVVEWIISGIVDTIENS
jgi:site-specific DNA-cytosine methylase